MPARGTLAGLRGHRGDSALQERLLSCFLFLFTTDGVCTQILICFNGLGKSTQPNNWLFNWLRHWIQTKSSPIVCILEIVLEPSIHKSSPCRITYLPETPPHAPFLPPETAITDDLLVARSKWPSINSCLTFQITESWRCLPADQ